MSYLNDPTTHQLATHCVVCSRKLRDAKSVELGIGPICRKKLNHADWGLDDEAQATANKLIHKAGIAARAEDFETVLTVADELADLGLATTADVLRTKFIKIRLERDSDVQVYGWSRERGGYAIEGQTRDVIKVFTPYSPEFNAERKRMRLRARPVKEGKVFYWEFGADQGGDVLELLSRVFPGRTAMGPKGPFRIPPEKDVHTCAVGGAA